MNALDRPRLLILDSLNGLPNAPALTDGAIEATTPLARSAEEAMARLAKWSARFERGQRPATVRAVRTDWKQYLLWCQGTGHIPLPASLDQVEAFLQNAIGRGRKKATVQRYAYTVGLAHDAAGLPNPVKGREWKLVWSGLQERLRELGNISSKQARELRSGGVAEILASLGDTTRELRDAAMLALASDAMLRESELVAVKLEHFHHDETQGAWTLFVPFSKANKDGEEKDYRYVDDTTKARIDRWCATAGISRGYVFLPMGGRPRKASTAFAPALLPQEVARIFRRRARAAGVAGAEEISGHSTRVGMANDLVNAGKTTEQIKHAGGWRSDRMVTLYTRRSQAGINAVAELRRERREADKPSGA